MEMISMREVEEANEKAGQFWFSPDTLRFFSSRHGGTAYLVGRKAFFISSEQDKSSSGGGAWDGKRRYSIRVCDMDTGSIDTVGEFGAYGTQGQAKKALQKIISGDQKED